MCLTWNLESLAATIEQNTTALIILDHKILRDTKTIGNLEKGLHFEGQLRMRGETAHPGFIITLRTSTCLLKWHAFPYAPETL